MSNPGVIVLACLRGAGPNVARFDVEDNIGEAIHIHWNGFRIDMTVQEFLQFSDELIACENALHAQKGYDISGFDPFFLFRMGPWVSRIKRVEIEERRLGDLTCLVRVEIPKIGHVMLPRSVSQTPAYRYLGGEKGLFREYQQDAYPGIANEARLNQLVVAIRKHGYPYLNGYITIFGNQNYIRDGQHRAAVLAIAGGTDQKVPVRVVYFDRQGWQIRPYGHLFVGLVKQFAVKVMRKGKAQLKVMLGRVR